VSAALLAAGGEIPPVAKAAPRPINPWLVAVTVTLATFMELLDTSIANVALPHIAGGLSAGLDETTWVLTSYLVANAVVLPLSAWLSTIFGRKRFYMTCVVLFTVSSLLCGLAPNLESLIFFRVLQGIGGGGLAPSEQAILVDTFPPAKRAAAFAVYSIAIVLGPAFGPTLGGIITDSSTWRWCFFINIPIGILSLVLTYFLVRESPAMIERTRAARQGGIKVDYLGVILIAVGFGFLEVVLDKGQRDDWLESSFICWSLFIAVVSLVTAVFWELNQKDPVVDLTLLKDRNFALANVFYFLFGVILLGATVLQPEWVQTLLGYTATDAGLTLSPGALVIVCMIPIVVRLTKVTGPKNLIIFGFAWVAGALWYYTTLDLDMTFGNAVTARVLLGFGLSFLFVPMSIVAYSYLPKEKNDKASSLTNLARNLGGSFGISFVTTMLARRAQYHQSVLVDHISPYDLVFTQRLHAISSELMQRGESTTEALAKARGVIASLVDQQANLLSFLDCFMLLIPVALAGVAAGFLIRKVKAPAGPAGAH
jgi:MFS transporter, DHA2 family, multidrug resistance protein